MNETLKHKRGFTIIEVVLVLAIAGLIFLMVFIALPALQRAQRNTQRKHNMDRVIASVIEYQKNNNYLTPFEPYQENSTDKGLARIKIFINRYLDSECTEIKRNQHYYWPQACSDEFSDPDGTPYGFDMRSDTHTSSQKEQQVHFFNKSGARVGVGGISEVTHLIAVFTMGKCSDKEGYVVWTDGPHDIAMWYALEGGGIYCVDNQ